MIGAIDFDGQNLTMERITKHTVGQINNRNYNFTVIYYL